MSYSQVISCQKCGAVLADGNKFCQQCGQPVSPAGTPSPALADYRRQLAGQIDELKRICGYAQKLGLAEVVSRADSVLTRIENQTFTVAVVGEYARGKTTLINALLGKEVLPADVLPCSATLNRVTYGRTPFAELVFKAREGQPQRVERIPIEELGIFVNRLTPDFETKATDIREVVAHYPTGYAEGVDIIDTPGLNDDDTMTPMTLSVLPTVDAVIMVILAQSPFSGLESDFLTNRILINDIGRVLFVVNRIDEIRKKEDQERILKAIEDRIANAVRARAAELYGENSKAYEQFVGRISPLKVFGVSSADALEAKLNGDAALLEESRFPQFEAALMHLLAHNRGEIYKQVLISCTAHATAKIVTLLFQRGQDAYRNQEYQPAIADFTDALALDPDNANVRQALADCRKIAASQPPAKAKPAAAPACQSCGAALSPGVKFCEMCGKPVARPAEPATAATERTTGLTNGSTAGLTVTPGSGLSLAQTLAAAPDGSTILLAPGRHVLAQPLLINKSVQLVGAGMEATALVSSAGEYVVKFSGSGRFTAEGIAFQYEGEKAASVVRAENGEVSLHQCSFSGGVLGEKVGLFKGQNFGDGLVLAGTLTGEVSECLAADNGRSGIWIIEKAQPRLKGNLCAQNAIAGIAIIEQAQPILEENTCQNNQNSGISYVGDAGGWARNNKCIENLIGIIVTRQSKPTLEGNLCRDNKSSGIAFLKNAGGIARNNHCIGTQNAHGFEISGEASPILEENVCEGNNWCGILYADKASGLARRNQCVNNLVGIIVQEQAQPVLEENVCWENHQQGIRVLSSAKPRQLNNQAINNEKGKSLDSVISL